MILCSQDEDTTSLHGSLMSEDAAVTQYLIAHGADVEGNDSMVRSRLSAKCELDAFVV